MSVLRNTALIALAFAAGLSLSPLLAPAVGQTMSQQLLKVFDTLERIQREVPNPPSELKLMRAATRGLVTALGDPYSDYLEPEAYAALTQEKEGQVVGIGIELAYRDSKVLIMSVLDQTPAAEAGLKARDVIQAIDGKDVSALSWADTLTLLQGEAGEPVTLTILSEGAERPVNRRLVRQVINVLALSLMPLGQDLCQLKIRTFFNENLHSQLGTLLATELENCAGGLIVDLRNNPGGLLDEAIAVAGQLGITGTIVQTVNRDGVVTASTAEAESMIPDTLPMLVLINQGTASAAEVLAAALQESGRASLMGEKSFGKGLIQSLLPLADGSGLSLTTGRYLTRRGHDLNQLGIQPDLPVSADNPDELLQQAQNYLLSGS